MKEGLTEAGFRVPGENDSIAQLMKKIPQKVYAIAHKKLWNQKTTDSDIKKFCDANKCDFNALKTMLSWGIDPLDYLEEGFSKSNPRTGPSTITKKGLTHWGDTKPSGQEPDSECWKCGYVGKDFIWGNNSVKCPSCGKTFKNFEEGFNKPGARGTIVTKTCPTCKGRGSPAPTTTPQQYPCKACKGTGKTWKSVPYPGQGKNHPYKTDTNPYDITDQVIDAVAKGIAIPTMSDSEKREAEQHVRNLPPAKVAHLAKSMTENGFDADFGNEYHTSVGKTRLQWNEHNKRLRVIIGGKMMLVDGLDTLDKVKDFIDKHESEIGSCSTMKQMMKVLPQRVKEGSKTPRFTPSEIKSQKIGLDKALKSNRFTPQEKKGMKKEMSTVGGIGGFNAPMGTDRKGIKHNFKVEEMKTLRKLVKEATAKSKPPMDLSKVAHSFTSFIDKKSKSGELQKQFGSGYSPEKFMAWLESETEKEGCRVSDEYLRKLKSRLTGQAVKDMKTVYFADLKGAGLGVGQLNKQSKGDDDVIDEEEWQ